jgi:LmbE family N-acetylglucosaminyl deacetylase
MKIYQSHNLQSYIQPILRRYSKHFGESFFILMKYFKNRLFFAKIFNDLKKYIYMNQLFKSLQFCFYLFLISTPSVSKAQVAPRKPTSADIYDAIKKLNVLGSVLYVAAHPDDENTRLISYMANEKKMHTTYLSITRGDGGQNLIGTELREMLGVLRTQELLMARSVDGGKQLFTRGNDFGFSKSPAETMQIWNKKEVLGDVVWAIRKAQPDIIINRFSVDTTVDTHGHHTASAILALEAFDLAADPKAYPEQLKYVKTWQAKRQFFNTSWFFYGSQEAFEKADKTNMLKLDLGVYYPTKGKSNNEIATESRSMHRCQGFGGIGSRGADADYLNYLKGIGRPKGDDAMGGIDISWKRIEGGEAIGKLLADAERNFKFDNPSASVPDLVKALKLIENIKDPFWKERKSSDIKDVIRWCMGLYLEAIVNTPSVVQGQEAEISLEAINRSSIGIKLKSMAIEEFNATNMEYKTLKDSILNIDLKNNERKNFKTKIKIGKAFTNPYWLNETPTLGMYNVSNPLLRGLPETPRSLRVAYDIEIENITFKHTADVVHKYGNPAKGEIYRPLEVTPSVFVNLAEKVYVFGDNEPKTIGFIVRAGTDKVKGVLQPTVPNNWKIEPISVEFDLKQKNEEKTISFKLYPPQGENEATISAKVLMPVSNTPNAELKPIETGSVRFIEYDHIPTQTVLQPIQARIVKLNILRRGNEIGYIMGAGDDMPACLEQIGYQVTDLKDHHFSSADMLTKYDAIVIGIRAYNTKEKLKFYNETLLEYVKNGGTVVVQYNTNGRDLVTNNLGPYPFKIGRGRTTEEDAEIRILKPEHSIMNMPNKITKKDFDGWVQERGLYFLSEWDSQYEAVLSCNDTNEKKEDGGLIVGKYGKGHYVYTGYSFFRQLPAGVSGAYRLFANILSIGKQLP